MSQFGDLVRTLRKDKGLTLEDVAKKIGSHKGYVSGIENGKVNPPSVKFIRKFSRLFKYDEREMVRIAYVDKAPKLIREEVRTLFSTRPRGKRNGSTTVEIPLLNRVESGYSTNVTSGGRISPLTDETLVVPRNGDGPSAAATVCDNSMEASEGPTFRRGDIVLLAPLDKPQSGAIVHVVFSDRDRKVATIRQLILEPKGNVVLQPLNKDFPLEFLDKDEIDAVYAVTGRLELFTSQPKPVEV